MTGDYSGAKCDFLNDAARARNDRGDNVSKSRELNREETRPATVDETVTVTDGRGQLVAARTVAGHVRLMLLLA